MVSITDIPLRSRGLYQSIEYRYFLYICIYILSVYIEYRYFIKYKNTDDFVGGGGLCVKVSLWLKSGTKNRYLEIPLMYLSCYTSHIIYEIDR